MRPLALAVALVLLLPFALAAGPSGTDPAGDVHWQQTRPGGPDLFAPLGCTDPKVDIRSWNVWTDGDRLRGSLNVTDGAGVPSCSGGSVSLFRLNGFASIRFDAGGGSSGVIAYDLDDFCIMTVVSGGFGSTGSWPVSDSTCKLVGNEFRFNFSANGTLDGVAYDFRGATFNAFAIASEIVGVTPVLQVAEGRIQDLGIP